MKNAWIAAFAVAASQSVSAAPILDTVIVGNQEWAQADLFTYVSWNTLNTQCPAGVCTLASAINGYDLAGWTWASIQDVQSLFDSFTGQDAPAPAVFSQFDSLWAPLFMDAFRPTILLGDAISVRGWTSTHSHEDRAFYAEMFDAQFFYFDEASTVYSFFQADERFYVGAWFVRDTAQVPAPATLTLFGLGLASLWMTRRKVPTT
jgi:hypothetical protein